MKELITVVCWVTGLNINEVRKLGISKAFWYADIAEKRIEIERDIIAAGIHKAFQDYEP